MDPTATLADILRNLDNARGMDAGEDRDDIIGNALDSMRHLADWLERGGFPPDARRATERGMPEWLETVREAGRRTAR